MPSSSRRRRRRPSPRPSSPPPSPSMPHRTSPPPSPSRPASPPSPSMPHHTSPTPPSPPPMSERTSPPSPMPRGTAGQSAPRMPPQRLPSGQREWKTFLLPNNVPIRVCRDSQGAFFTRHNGRMRPLADLYREIFSTDRDLAQALGRRREDCVEEDADAAHMLQMSLRLEESERETTLEESSSSSTQQTIRLEESERETKLEESSSSSTPQTTRREESERETTPEESSSSSTQQTTRFKVPDLSALMLDINLMASSCISILVPAGLMIKYFVRVDNDGYFHTYPDRGGPFESIQETQEAIDSHHAPQRKNICMDGLSDEDKAARYALYWYHNGTRKHSAEAYAACTTNLPTEELVKAVLDKYNEDAGLVGDVAYELKDIVSYNICCDGKDCIYRSYYHYNLTIKTQGVDASSNVYFAEITCMDCDGAYEAYVLTYFCMVKPDDNGVCHVCESNIKHPTNGGYNLGRPKVIRRRYRRESGLSLFEQLFAVRDQAWLDEEEARVKRTIKEGLEEAKVRRTIKEGLKKEEASPTLKVDTIKEGLKKEDGSPMLKVDTIGLKKEEASPMLKVDAIKEGLKKEEASPMLKVDKKRDHHPKKDKYVVPALRR